MENLTLSIPFLYWFGLCLFVVVVVVVLLWCGVVAGKTSLSKPV